MAVCASSLISTFTALATICNVRPLIFVTRSRLLKLLVEFLNLETLKTPKQPPRLKADVLNNTVVSLSLSE